MDDLRVVFESRNRRSCSDRALVLAAIRIPYQLVDDGESCAIVVPAEHSARAVEELRLYEEENNRLSQGRLRSVASTGFLTNWSIG